MLENRERILGSNPEIGEMLYNSSAFKRLQIAAGSRRVEHLPGLFHQYLTTDYLRKKYPSSLVLDEDVLSARLKDVAKREGSPLRDVHHNFFTVWGKRPDRSYCYPIPDALIFDEIEPPYYQLTKVVESRLGKVDEKSAKNLHFPGSLGRLLKLLNIPMYKRAFEQAISLELERSFILTLPLNFERFYLLVVPWQVSEIPSNSRVALEILPYSREDVHNVVRTLTS